jgi:hypothetical protein
VLVYSISRLKDFCKRDWVILVVYHVLLS